MSKQHHFIAGNDFSKKTRTALAKKGIYVIGIQMVQGANGWFDAYPAYCLDNNNTNQVRSRFDVEAMSK